MAFTHRQAKILQLTTGGLPLEYISVIDEVFVSENSFVQHYPIILDIVSDVQVVDYNYQLSDKIVFQVFSDVSVTENEAQPHIYNLEFEVISNVAILDWTVESKLKDPPSEHRRASIIYFPEQFLSIHITDDVIILEHQRTANGPFIDIEGVYSKVTAWEDQYTPFMQADITVVVTSGVTVALSGSQEVLAGVKPVSNVKIEEFIRVAVNPFIDIEGVESIVSVSDANSGPLPWYDLKIDTISSSVSVTVATMTPLPWYDLEASTYSEVSAISETPALTANAYNLISVYSEVETESIRVRAANVPFMDIENIYSDVEVTTAMTAGSWKDLSASVVSDVENESLPPAFVMWSDITLYVTSGIYVSEGTASVSGHWETNSYVQVTEALTATIFTPPVIIDVTSVVTGINDYSLTKVVTDAVEPCVWSYAWARQTLDTEDGTREVFSMVNIFDSVVVKCAPVHAIIQTNIKVTEYLDIYIGWKPRGLAYTSILT